MNLSNKQKLIVTTRESKVVVIAAAASGKTTIMTERIRYLLDSGVDPRSIVAITFTNNAANELYDRLGNPKDLFIGTIHAYANYLLLSNGVSTGSLLDNENFDELFRLIEKYPDSVKPVTHLLLDEAQDSNELQFKFIFDRIKPKNYMLVGDYRQCIYQFNGAEPDLLLNLTNKPFVTTYELNENYRNGTKILYFAKRIIEKIGYSHRDLSIPMRGVDGYVTEIPLAYRTFIRLVSTIDTYGDWFVLTRTNGELEAVKSALEDANIPCDTFKRSELTNEELRQRMNENTVKVLTIHAAKGLEAKNVIAIGARFYSDEERRVSYVAATRARDRLYWCPHNQRGHFGQCKSLPSNFVQWD